MHPIHGLDIYGPRTGLRRWTAEARSHTGELAAHAAVHDDGFVTMGWAAGGASDDPSNRVFDREITSGRIETFVADLLALVRAVGDAGHGGYYEIRVGIEWLGGGPLLCRVLDPYGRAQGASTAFSEQFTPVQATLNTTDSDADYYADVRAVALDCVSQFGIARLTTLLEPPLPPRR